MEVSQSVSEAVSARSVLKVEDISFIRRSGALRVPASTLLISE